jgi:hypothetical protein
MPFAPVRIRALERSPRGVHSIEPIDEPSPPVASKFGAEPRDTRIRGSSLSKCLDGILNDISPTAADGIERVVDNACGEGTALHRHRRLDAPGIRRRIVGLDVIDIASNVDAYEAADGIQYLAVVADNEGSTCRGHGGLGGPAIRRGIERLDGVQYDVRVGATGSADGVKYAVDFSRGEVCTRCRHGCFGRPLSVTVWPYISYKSTVSDTGVQLDVENVGLGPAIVRGAALFIDGKGQPSLSAALRQLGYENKHGNTVALSSLGGGSVIRAGEAVTLARVRSALFASQAAAMQQRVRIETCYCSILNQCWLAKSGADAPTDVANCDSMSKASLIP